MNGSFAVENFVNTMNGEMALGLNIYGAFNDSKVSALPDALGILLSPEKPSNLRFIGKKDAESYYE